MPRKPVNIARQVVETEIKAFLDAHPDAVHPSWFTLVRADDSGRMVPKIVHSITKRVVGNLARTFPGLKQRGLE